MKQLRAFPSYKVDRHGRVYNKSGHEMSPVKSSHGLRVQLWLNSKSFMRYVHVLVWHTFRGPIPKGYVVKQHDGNKLNAALSNLCLSTRHHCKRKHILCHEERFIVMKDPFTEKTKRFRSVKEACVSGSGIPGAHPSNISRAIKTGGTAYGKFWSAWEKDPTTREEKQLPRNDAFP